MKKKSIAVLVEDKKISAFLSDFFTGRKDYAPHYSASPAELFDHIAYVPPDAVLISVAFVRQVSRIFGQVPSIALISGDIKEGIKKAVDCGVDCCLYPPYLGMDLDHKIKKVVSEKAIRTSLETKKQELESVVELMQLVTGTLDSKEILYRIVKKISEIISVTRCSIIKIDRERGAAVVVASYEDRSLSAIELDLDRYPEILEALSSEKNVVIRDVSNDPIMRSVKKTISPLGIRSILVIPVFHESRVIGTLFLRTSRAQNTFSDSEIRLLNSLAAAASNSLYNAFLFEQVEDEKTRLEKLSITDYLTGIYNIRYFYHRIAQEFSRSQRYASPLSCLMLDLDHFKKINDTYGHKAGDVILKEFAGLLKKSSRQSDVLARYGGEEFIILLPETSIEGVLAEAERIRLCIKTHRFKNLKTSKEITASIGIATYPNPRIKTYDDLIASADTALFEAKNSGRDKVSVYGG